MSEEMFSLKHSEEIRRDRACAVKLLDRMIANRIEVVVYEPNACYLSVHYMQTLDRDHPLSNAT